MTARKDDGLRARMATLLKTPVPVLRKRLAAAGQDPAGLSKDALVKALATAPATAPAKSPAPKQAKAAKSSPPTTRKTGARDPRLPQPPARITRSFKGREYVLEILERGFRVGTKEYASTTAAALAICGYGAVSGPAWWGYAKPAPEKLAATKAPRKGRKG